MVNAFMKYNRIVLAFILTSVVLFASCHKKPHPPLPEQIEIIDSLIFLTHDYLRKIEIDRCKFFLAYLSHHDNLLLCV